MFRKLASMFRAIVMLDDTPHSIALGTAIGLFIAWTPTVGIHMILVVALALLFRANKVAGLRPGREHIASSGSQSGG